MTEVLLRVHEIALEVRAWTERAAIKAGEWDSTDLCGWCAIASAELQRRLLRENIKAELHLAMRGMSCHVYVVVDDHVVDVTATQFREFRNSTVVLEHHKEVEYLWYYQTSQVFASGKDLRKHQIREQWPREQIAYG